MNPGTRTSPTALSTKIIRNVLVGGLRYLLVAPVPFLLTPLILRKIGPKGYGTWAVFGAINSMTSLADLGMVGTLSKYVAEHYAKRDFISINRLINTAIALFGFICVFLVTCLWVGSSLVVKLLFRGSPMGRPELVTLFRFFLIAIAANILIMLFSSITTGLQRLDLTNIISTINVLSTAIIAAVLLLAGQGLSGLIRASICGTCLALVIYLTLTLKLLPELAWNPRLISIGEGKRIFNFSLQFYLTQAAVAIHNQLEKILLAFFVGVAPAGWYDIASDVSLKIRGGIGLLLSPILPAASELQAIDDQSRLDDLYYRTHKYLACVGVPLVLYIAAVSSRFVELWVGPGLKPIARPMAILLLVNLFNMATGPGFLILVGRGNLKPGLQSALLGIILNIVFSTVLVLHFGFQGAVIGTSAALVIASIYFFYEFSTLTGNSLMRLAPSYLKPAACSITIIVILRLVHPFATLSWLQLAEDALVFGCAYALVLPFSRFFDQYDLSKMESFVPAMRYARRIIPVA